MKISKAFQVFNESAPSHAKAWSEMVVSLSKANKLDEKTSSLVYVGILAALGMESGIPFHVNVAKKSGASLEEVISAALIGLPPAGHKVTQVLPLIIESYND